MFTRPGARWNEDAVGGGGSFLYVLDGATSLDAAPVMDPVMTRPGWSGRPPGGWTAICRSVPPLEDILAQGMAQLLDQWSGPRAASLGRGGDFPPAGRKGGSTLAWGTVPPASS